MDISAIQSSIGSYLPDSIKPENEKDDKWYIQATNAILSKWYITGGLFNNENGKLSYWKHYQYYWGDQDGDSYNYMREAGPELNLPAVFVPGQMIKTFVDNMMGKIIETIDQFNVMGKVDSLDCLKLKKELKNKVYAWYAEKEFFDNMQAQTGVPFQPIPGFNPQSKEEIDEFFEKFQLETEKIATFLARTDMARNHYYDILLRVLFDSIVAGVGSIRVQVENGITKWHHIPALYAIIDPAPFSDLNRNADYGGDIQMLSIPQIIEQFNLSKVQIAELKELANSPDNMNKINQSTGFLWWNYSGSAAPKAAVVRVAFKDVKLVPGEMQFTNRGGKESKEHILIYDRYSESRKRKLKSKKITFKPKQTIREVVLIGNCILAVAGEMPDQVYENRSNGEKQIPYINFTHGMMYGKVVSVAQRLERIQDQIDMYEFKILVAAARDKGKVLGYITSLLPEKYGGDIATMLADLQREGIVEIDPTMLQDPALMANGNLAQAIKVLDFSMKPEDIAAYQSMISMKKGEMAQIVSIPPAAQGMQTEIIGKGVQDQTVQLANIGQLWFYRMSVKYVERLLQYSINVSKNVLLIDGDFEGAFNINDYDYEFLKISQDMLFEDLMCYIKVHDAVDKASKDALIQLELAAAQNQQVVDIAHIKMLKAKTFDELVLVAEQAAKRKAIEQQQAAAQQAQMEQAAIQAKGQAAIAPVQLQAQTNMQIAAMQEQGKDKRQGDQTKGQVLKAAIDHVGKHHLQQQDHFNTLHEATHAAVMAPEPQEPMEGE